MKLQNTNQEIYPPYITEISDDLFRIKIPLARNPLKTINSYLIKGDDRNLLVDTGYRIDSSINTIKDALAYLEVKAEDTDILLTHFHNDHAGASTELIHPDRKIYVPIQEKRFFGIGSDPDYYKECRRDRYLTEGLTETDFEVIMNLKKANSWMPDFFSTQYEYIEEKQIISAGNYHLTAIHTPGHSPGHMCYWDEAHRIMFTGDHLLFDISPNIIPWPTIPNILAIYLYSLKKLRDYPVELALPGHRETGDFTARIHEQIRHHENRLKECESIVKLYPYKTAFEITSLLSWKIRNNDGTKGIPVNMMRYAFGECICHLDYLRFQKKIQRVLDNNTYRYC